MPTYQRPYVATESSKLVPPHSPKWRLMLLKFLTEPKQQESIVKERSLLTLFKSIGVGILLSFMVSLFNFCAVAIFVKKYPGSFTFENLKRRECFIFTVAMGRWRLPTIATMVHNTNGPCDVTLVCCYYDCALLSVTQSRNGCGDIVGPFSTVNLNHLVPWSRCPSLLWSGPLDSDPTWQLAWWSHRPISTVNLKRGAPWPRHLFELATSGGYLNCSDGSLFINNRSLSPSRLSLILQWTNNGFQQQQQAQIGGGQGWVGGGHEKDHVGIGTCDLVDPGICQCKNTDKFVVVKYM
jgi:hypothetical protein